MRGLYLVTDRALCGHRTLEETGLRNFGIDNPHIFLG